MKLSIIDSGRCVGCQSCMFACSRRNGNAGLTNTAIMVKSKGGVETGFNVIVCSSCVDPPCAKACPTQALTPKEGGGVKFNPNKCIGCKKCVDACIIGAVNWNDEQMKPVICIQCGYCVDYCPHGVLELIK
ncbi:MAG: 4Fe-4S binding protein [Bacteroidales bacterium]|nr:4Fe-4S binding protein [Bacteroidales bacterium]